MPRKRLDWLLLVHVLIIVWALLFGCSLLFVPDGGKLAKMLAPGNLVAVFISIPLAVFSLMARAKQRFSEICSTPILVLSIVSICIGIAGWIFLIMIMRMP